MKWSSRFLLALAALVHLGLLVGWRWQMPLVPYFFDATVLSGGRGLDFYSIYQAGYNARHGADVYESDPAKIAIAVPYFTPYRYLPIVAYTAGAALSLFSPLTAYKIWVVVVELTLLLCVFITYRRVRDLNLFARLAAMWLCFTPYYLELFMGQFSLVQGALVFGMLCLTPLPPSPDDDEAVVRRGGSRNASPPLPKRALPLRERGPGGEASWWFDALWLASVLWKINTIVFAPVFLRLRRYRALAVTTSVVALTTIPYFLIFPAHLRDFLLNNFGNSVTHHELGNLGLRQLIFEILAAAGASPGLQRLAQLALVAFVLGVSILITFYPTRLSLRPFHLEFGRWDLGFPPSTFHLPPFTLLSLWLTAFFLISPQIWEHHYVMLLPVLVMAYWHKPNWFVIIVWLLLALPTPFGFIGLQPVIAANHDLRAFLLEPVWQPLLQHASKAVPTLMLYLYFALRLLHRPDRSREAPPE
ncbi:MAG: hypothetical protein HW378_4290 [Anaerolineales bacterium]|nr:hypothetical protein [Anaerolineales bacterium]